MIPMDSVTGVLLYLHHFFSYSYDAYISFFNKKRKGHIAYTHDSLNDCNRNDFMTVRAKDGDVHKQQRRLFKRVI
jgi:hypothetical protein